MSPRQTSCTRKREKSICSLFCKGEDESKMTVLLSHGTKYVIKLPDNVISFELVHSVISTDRDAYATSDETSFLISVLQTSKNGLPKFAKDSGVGLSIDRRNQSSRAISGSFAHRSLFCVLIGSTNV
jgi:hypothetical protein